jgi:hypothetical protein
MPVDLPDISFNEGRIDLSRYDNRYFQISNLNLIGYRTREQLLFNANLDPKIIIKEAFEKYIVNTPIESNSIGINIIYRRNRTSGVKNIFIAKRNFEGETTQNILQGSLEPEYIRRATNSNVFENNEIDAVLERSFGKIIQVTLCEIYNDDPVSVRRRSPGKYYPFLVTIALLYRKIPRDMHEEARNTAAEGDAAWIRNNGPPSQRLSEEEEIELQRMRLENMLNPGTHEIDEPQTTYQEVDRPSEHTPRPLQMVEDPEILNKPLTSYVWPGMCQICLDSDTAGLCRVNCDAGHIFHCDCINGFRDTYTLYGWNNKCPVCRTLIDKMVSVTPEYATLLPTSFGKAKRCSKDLTLKQIDKLIKLLSK